MIIYIYTYSLKRQKWTEFNCFIFILLRLPKYLSFWILVFSLAGIPYRYSWLRSYPFFLRSSSSLACLFTSSSCNFSYFFYFWGVIFFQASANFLQLSPIFNFSPSFNLDLVNFCYSKKWSIYALKGFFGKTVPVSNSFDLCFLSRNLLLVPSALMKNPCSLNCYLSLS